MTIDEKDLYEEVGRKYRYFLDWRGELLAGYFAGLWDWQSRSTVSIRPSRCATRHSSTWQSHRSGTACAVTRGSKNACDRCKCAPPDWARCKELQTYISRKACWGSLFEARRAGISDAATVVRSIKTDVRGLIALRRLPQQHF